VTELISTGLNSDHPTAATSDNGPEARALDRVVVLGAVGAGKTRFSAQLAGCLGVRHVERDDLGFPIGSQDYLDRTAAEVAADCWVFDGPPYFAETLVYPRATTIIALDFERTVVLRRVLARTVKAMATQWPSRGAWEWNIFSSKHPIRWSWTTWAERRQQMADLRVNPIVKAAEFIHFGRPIEAEIWLVAICARGRKGSPAQAGT
jgi:adenylate kinase family enzyme